MKLSDVTKEFEGRLVRDGEFKRLDYCTVEEDGPFLSFMEREKYLPALVLNRHIGCVLCTEELADSIPDTIQGLFITPEPKACFEQIHNNLSNNADYKLPSFKTIIGENCKISPLAVISEDSVVIGNDVTIGPFVYIGDHVTIGNGCKIYNHATIGGRSFSYARVGDDDVTGLLDCGTVIVESGVEVMSYTHIARGILPTDCTLIGKNTILDAHIHIGHGAQLKSRVFVAAGAVISGNCRIGNDSWVGVNATISNRVIIGDRCRVSLGSVVTKNVPNDTTVTGNFAIEHHKYISKLKAQFFEEEYNSDDH